MDVKQALTTEFVGRFGWIMLAAAGMVLFCVSIYYRSVVTVLLAMLPVAAPGAVNLAVLAILKRPVNLMHCFGILMMIGLAVDYGIFGLRAVKCGRSDLVLPAMGMSFLTTLVGVGALLFSRHPMLFDIGLTLVIGITVAYLCGVLLVRALAQLAIRRKLLKFMVLPGLLLLAVGGGCRTSPFAHPEYPQLDRSESELRAELADWNAGRNTQPLVVHSNMVIDYGFFSLALLAVVQADFPTREIKAAAVTPVGMKMFELSGRNGAVENSAIAAVIPEKDRAEFAEAIFRDLNRIFFDLEAPADGEWLPEERMLVIRRKLPDGRTEKYHFAGNPLRLTAKSCGGFFRKDYQVDFYDYTRTAAGWQPGKVFYRNCRGSYTIAVRNTEKEAGQ